jgi:hypothetical protein
MVTPMSRARESWASEPFTIAETADLKQLIFVEARRMSNDQILELADALHDIIRTRQVIRRTHGIEPRSFAPEARRQGL